MSNDLPGSGRFVQVNQAIPTVSLVVDPSWCGCALETPTVVPLLPKVSFDARGLGRFSLTTDEKFPRGPRVSGRQGTVDLWVKMGVTGTARTIAYLTDSLVTPTSTLAVKVDSSNRPLVSLVNTVTPYTYATGTFSASGAIADTETVTIGTKVYTIQAALTEVDGHVQRGASQTATIANLVAAINLDLGSGTAYAAATTVHPLARAAMGTGASMLVTAKLPGPSGMIASTTTAALGAWTAGTLLGGRGTVLTKVAMTRSGASSATGAILHLRFAWNSQDPVVDPDYASFTINGEAITAGDWTTMPVADWTSWQPTHLVLGQGLLGEAAFNGTIQAVQLSDTVTL
jgi:hypothetical protein